MGLQTFKHLSEQNFLLTTLSLLKVSDAKTVSSIIYPDSTNPHSSVVQTQKQLNILADTGKLIRGKGWYALPSYRGSNPLHDRLITSVIARLILLKLPISVYREVSFPIGIRSDIIVLLGKNSQALCVVIEVANNETPEYLNQKITAWKNWAEGGEKCLKVYWES
jgi:hypothetical protein